MNSSIVDPMRLGRNFVTWVTHRRAQSLFCLVAALLLQSPVLAAAAIASGACCSGEHCPIAAHHHTSAKTEEMPMNCDHEMDHDAAKMRSCAMSCCDTTERSAVHSDVFLVSPVMQLASLNAPSETVSFFDGRETVLAFAPLSPPPKSALTLI